MDGLLILILVVVLLSGPVGLAVALTALRRTRELESRMGVPEHPAARPAAVTPTIAPVPVEDQAGAATAPEGSWADRLGRGLDLEAILGGQWLTWIGVLLLFCGTAFFLGVDLGESVLAGLPQVLIGLAIAAGFCVGGRYWSQAEQVRLLGLGLLGGGIALLYTVAYAAYGFHGLVSLWLVFPLLILVAVAGAVLALDRNSLTIAWLTLIGALLTPLLLSGAEADVRNLLPYLFAVNLGAVVLGLRRGWAALSLLAFAGTALLVGHWVIEHFNPDLRSFAVVAVGAIWLIHALSPWLSPGRSLLWGVARAVLVAANGLFFGLFLFHVLSGDLADLQALALTLLALVYLGLSYWISRRDARDPGAEFSFYTGVALGAIAIPVQFDLAAVTLGWTALAAILLYSGLRGHRRGHRLAGLGVLALSLGRVVFLDDPVAGSVDATAILNAEFLSGFAVAGLLLWVSRAYRQVEKQGLESRLATPLLVAGVLLFWWKATAELLTWWQYQSVLGREVLTHASLSLLWALYAGIVLAAGVLVRSGALRTTGLLLLALTAIKLMLFDVMLGRGDAAGTSAFAGLPFLSGLALTVMMVVGARLFRDHAVQLGDTHRRLTMPLFLTALSVLIWQISAEIFAFFSVRGPLADDSGHLRAQMTLSLVWALYAGAIIAAGFVRRVKALRLFGIVLLAVTILKVFLVDLTELERGYRVAAFVGLGILVLVVSLSYQRRATSGQQDRSAGQAPPPNPPV